MQQNTDLTHELHKAEPGRQHKLTFLRGVRFNLRFARLLALGYLLLGSLILHTDKSILT